MPKKNNNLLDKVKYHIDYVMKNQFLYIKYLLIGLIVFLISLWVFK